MNISIAKPILPNSIVFVPQVQHAMGENDKKDIVWQDTYRIIRNPQEEDEDGEVYQRIIIRC